MKVSILILVILLALSVILSGCVTPPSCGNKVCEFGETASSCPIDCSSSEVNEAQARASWKSAEPFAIIDWEIDQQYVTVILRNNSFESLNLERVTLFGAFNSTIDSIVPPGGKKTVEIMYSGSCQLGEKKEIPKEEILISYDTEAINGKIQKGVAPIIGTCIKNITTIKTLANGLLTVKDGGATTTQKIKLLSGETINTQNFEEYGFDKHSINLLVFKEQLGPSGPIVMTDYGDGTITMINNTLGDFQYSPRVICEQTGESLNATLNLDFNLAQYGLQDMTQQCGNYDYQPCCAILFNYPGSEPIEEAAARAAWKSAEPFGITDWSIGQQYINVVVRNNSFNTLTLQDFSLFDQYKLYVHEDDDILPGETRKLKIMYSGSCTSGDRIDIPASKISMTYNTENINGKIQTGIAPIISTCSGVDYNSTYTLEVGDYIQTISGTDFPGDLVELKLEDIVYLGSSGGIYQAKWQLGHEGVIQKVIIAGNNADLKEEFGSEYLNASTVVSNIQADGTYSADIQIV